jgi:uncharacterized protein YkwD
MSGLGRILLAASIAVTSSIFPPAVARAAPTRKPAPATKAAAPAAATKAPELSPEQRKKLIEAFDEFARSKAGSDAWFAAGEKVLNFGPEGARKALATVEACYRNLGRQYKTAFARRAGQVMTDRLAELKKQGKSAAQIDQDIRAARQPVLDLLAMPEPDKAEIVAKGDPAMITLDKLMGLDRQAILDGDEALGKQRQELLRAWLLRDRCCGEQQGGQPQTRLAALEEVVAMQAMPIPPADRNTLEGNFAMSDKLAPEEAEGIRDLNRMRLLLGMDALAIDLKLCEAARGHSKDMTEKKFFAHDSPVPGKATPWDRARQAGTSASAENIAAGTATGAGANKMWFHSPGHFKNMLSTGHHRMGLGNSGKIWTQMFGH